MKYNLPLRRGVDQLCSTAVCCQILHKTLYTAKTTAQVHCQPQSYRDRVDQSLLTYLPTKKGFSYLTNVKVYMQNGQINQNEKVILSGGSYPDLSAVKVQIVPQGPDTVGDDEMKSMQGLWSLTRHVDRFKVWQK